MAVTIVASFTLIIPIEWVIWLLALPSGLLIGYYANQRSNRRAGPWRRILANGLFAGLVTGSDDGGSRPRHQGAVLLRRQRLSRSGAWRLDQLCGRRRLRLSALSRGRPGPGLIAAGVTDAASFAGFYWREQLGSAGTIVLALTTLGGLGGAGLYGVFRPKAPAAAEPPSRRALAG